MGTIATESYKSVLKKQRNKFSGKGLIKSIRKNIDNNDEEYPEVFKQQEIIISAYTSGIAFLRFDGKEMLELEYKDFISYRNHTGRLILSSEYIINYLIDMRRKGIEFKKIHYVSNFIRYADEFNVKIKYELEAYMVIRADALRILGIGDDMFSRIRIDDIFTHDISSCMGTTGSTSYTVGKGQINAVMMFIYYLYGIDVKNRLETIFKRFTLFYDDTMGIENNPQLTNVIMSFNFLIRKRYGEYYYKKLQDTFGVDVKKIRKYNKLKRRD